MSGEGRGRGAGAKPNNRASSSSSEASSRSSSIGRPSSSQDTDRLMKELSKTTGPGAVTGLRTSGPPATRFKPNISAAKKEKDKSDSSNDPTTSSSNYDQTSINKKDSMNHNKFRTPRGGHNHRSHNDRANYIQTESIFQTNVPIPTTQSPSGSSSRMPSVKHESSTSNIRTLHVKTLGTAKTTLIGDVDGLRYEIDEEYEPRQIPLAEQKSVFDVKQESDLIHKIKKPTITTSTSNEHIDSFVRLFSQQKLESSTKLNIKAEPTEPTDIPKPQEVQNDQSQLILMQFPDVLPCTRTSSSTDKTELTSLSDLPDGFLGKLQIFKSGKCRLKLNDNTYLDVGIGQPTSFLQNVMVTEMASTNPTNQSEINNDMNKLICLGDIKHKLIVSLDVDHVLHDTRQ